MNVRRDRREVRRWCDARRRARAAPRGARRAVALVRGEAVLRELRRAARTSMRSRCTLAMIDAAEIDLTFASPSTIASDRHRPAWAAGCRRPAPSRGFRRRPSTARLIASIVACRMLSASISSTLACADRAAQRLVADLVVRASRAAAASAPSNRPGRGCASRRRGSPRRRRPGPASGPRPASSTPGACRPAQRLASDQRRRVCSGAAQDEDFFDGIGGERGGVALRGRACSARKRSLHGRAFCQGCPASPRARRASDSGVALRLQQLRHRRSRRTGCSAGRPTAAGAVRLHQRVGEPVHAVDDHHRPLEQRRLERRRAAGDQRRRRRRRAPRATGRRAMRQVARGAGCRRSARSMRGCSAGIAGQHEAQARAASRCSSAAAREEARPRCTRSRSARLPGSSATTVASSPAGRARRAPRPRRARCGITSASGWPT